MASIACTVCPKKFRNQSGLDWHLSHIHQIALEPRGPTTLDEREEPETAAIPPEVSEAVDPSDLDEWPSVDDLFEEDYPLALLDLLERDFPNLYEKVESLSRQYDIDREKERTEGLKEVRQVQEYSLGLISRMDTLERQTQRLFVMICSVGLMANHLDVHHRAITHGFERDPADADLELSDDGYRRLLKSIRAMLTDLIGPEQRRQLGLHAKFSDLLPSHQHRS